MYQLSSLSIHAECSSNPAVDAGPPLPSTAYILAPSLSASRKPVSSPRTCRGFVSPVTASSSISRYRSVWRVVGWEANRPLHLRSQVYPYFGHVQSSDTGPAASNRWVSCSTPRCQVLETQKPGDLGRRAIRTLYMEWHFRHQVPALAIESHLSPTT